MTNANQQIAAIVIFSCAMTSLIVIGSTTMDRVGGEAASIKDSIATSLATCDAPVEDAVLTYLDDPNSLQPVGFPIRLENEFDLTVSGEEAFARWTDERFLVISNSGETLCSAPFSLVLNEG